MTGVPLSVMPGKGLILRYKGIFDYGGLLVLIVDWLKQRRYWFQETTVKHKVPSPFGAEEERRFKAEKKITDYYKETAELKFHLWEINEVEVVKDGKKIKLIKARMEIVFKGGLVLDYQGRWDKSKLHQNVRKFIHEHVLKNKIESFWADELYYRLYKLHSLIKDYLDMQTKSWEYEGYMGDNV